MFVPIESDIRYINMALAKFVQIVARVLNPTQLFEEKEVYQQIGRMPRQKDKESKKYYNK